MRRYDFGVFIVYGSRAYNKIRIRAKVFRGMTDADLNTHRAQMPSFFTLAHVRTFYIESHADKHLCQRGHGNAANAYEMTLFAGDKISFKASHMCFLSVSLPQRTLQRHGDL